MLFDRNLAATFDCPMKLQKFPFDTQLCPVYFESFHAKTDNLVLSWLDSPVEVDPTVS